ncbi:MAG: hypothetical protein LBC77_09390 [Spirochaetaceae bacterium]|jgi:hypothetical protein|nr:hypothetical protein [Spirochaetaceae bacterium]
MSATRDWMPGTRAGQLVMARDWNAVIGGKASAWSIPQDVLTDLGALLQAAESALEVAQNEMSRTPVATARCKAAFEALTVKMRDIKKRYFLEPPLADADIISLGLKPRDGTHTMTGAPAAQAKAEIFLTGQHELGVKIVFVSGSADAPENHGFRVYYKEVAVGEPVPDNPDQLTKSFFTNRKKDVIEFDYNASGKTAYIAVQIENNGKKGPGGPMVNAIIP